jgi:polar amino acid transport system substrate-binding protein
MIKYKTISLIFLFLLYSVILQAEEQTVLTLASNEKAVEQVVASSILKDIYLRAGLKVNIIPMPAARANSTNLKGIHDGELARILAYSKKFPQLIRVEPAYYYLVSTAFSKTQNKIKIKSKADLAHLRIGVVRGVAHAELATVQLKNVDLVDDYEKLYTMLQSGRFDVVIDTEINGLYRIKKLGLKDVEIAGRLRKLELYNILNSKNSNLVPKISAAIQSLKNSGELDHLIKKYESEFSQSGAIP